MTIRPLTLEGAQEMLLLRDKYRASLRTDHPVNEEDQERWWYEATKRDGRARWWEVRDAARGLFGYCGIENIRPIERTGELSVLIDGTDEDWRHVFDIVWERAFNELNLQELHAEVYHCSPDLERWRDVASVFHVRPIVLPMRKFSGGRMWDSDYISWRLPS